MVAPTLLPKFLHFLVGLGAFFTQKSRKLGRVAKALQGRIDTGQTLTSLEAEDLTRAVREATFWGYAWASFAMVAVGVALVISTALVIWIVWSREFASVPRTIILEGSV